MVTTFQIVKLSDKYGVKVNSQYLSLTFTTGYYSISDEPKYCFQTEEIANNAIEYYKKNISLQPYESDKEQLISIQYHPNPEIITSDNTTLKPNSPLQNISELQQMYLAFGNPKIFLKTYCFDLDGTLCSHELYYMDAKPIMNRIDKVNKLYDEGHKIIIDSARGNTTEIQWLSKTKQQLDSWGLKYHILRTGHKMTADFYIDDKAITDKEFFK